MQSSPTKSPHPSRLPHLDSIRGLAALSVAVFHCLWHIVLVHRSGTAENVTSDVLAFLDLGKFGVVLFFAISGYVIPNSLPLGGKRPVATFLTSRFFRLFPAYWVSVLLGATFLWKWDLGWKVFVSNLTMLQRFVGMPDILGVYWTLQIELLFYAICAALLIAGLVRKQWATLTAFGLSLAVALVLAILRYRGMYQTPIAIPMSLAVMFWGDLNRSSAETGKHTTATVATVVLLLSLLPVCLLGYESTDTLLGGPRYIFTYAIAVVLFRIWSIRPTWHNRVFDYLGKISFSIYLMHPVAMGIDRALNDSINPWLTSLVVLGLTILGAALCHRFIEQPAIELGKRVRRRLAA